MHLDYILAGRSDMWWIILGQPVDLFRGHSLLDGRNKARLYTTSFAVFSKLSLQVNLTAYLCVLCCMLRHLVPILLHGSFHFLHPGWSSLAQPWSARPILAQILCPVALSAHAQSFRYLQLAHTKSGD